MPTLDPHQLQVVPEEKLRQSNYSSASLSPSSSSSSPVASDTTLASAPTLASTPTSILSPHSPLEACAYPSGDLEDVTLAAVSAPQAPASSTGTNPRRHFRCELGCSDIAFPSQRELKRHHNSLQHRPGLYDESSSQASLQCACGKVLLRRDNYKRHVKNCKRTAHQSFRCDHGHTGTNRDAWLIHLDDPGCKPPLGAPRRRPQP